MKNNSVLKGTIFVALGASSYGMLTTFVKMAYEEGFTTAEVTFSQLLLGFVGLTVLNIFIKNKKKADTPKKPKGKSILQLMLAGTSLGLTSLFYYSAVQYISVSIGIVMLMQSVWMGVVLDSVLLKAFPSKRKIIAVLVVLIGTLLATNVFMETATVDWRGIGFGLLAATSYTITIFASNRVATKLPALVRSKWMVFGGLVVVSLVMARTLYSGLDVSVFYFWGPILALFGTIFPPLLLTSGMPKINLGLGAIVSSLELPVAVMMAYFLLHEKVNVFQWLGIILILLSVVLMNYRSKKKLS